MSSFVIETLENLMVTACDPNRPEAVRRAAYQRYENQQWINAVTLRHFPICAIPRENAQAVMDELRSHELTLPKSSIQ